MAYECQQLGYSFAKISESVVKDRERCRLASDVRTGLFRAARDLSSQADSYSANPVQTI